MEVPLHKVYPEFQRARESAKAVTSSDNNDFNFTLARPPNTARVRTSGSSLGVAPRPKRSGAPLQSRLHRVWWCRFASPGSWPWAAYPPVLRLLSGAVPRSLGAFHSRAGCALMVSLNLFFFWPGAFSLRMIVFACFWPVSSRVLWRRCHLEHTIFFVPPSSGREPCDRPVPW